jgi:hypothetical protein
MRRPAPSQLPLFGSQYVHVGRYAPSSSLRTCIMCAVLLVVADEFDPCGACPGWVEPAPPWAVLDRTEPLEHLASEAAA